LNNLIKNLPDKLLKTFTMRRLAWVLNKAINQQKFDTNKIYSIHEPQTKCIAKGKTDKKYEFGSKVSLIISKSKGVILGALSFSNNPYDGDTIKPTLRQISTLHNGYKPKTIVADRGYKGCTKINGVKVITPYENKKGLLPRIVKKIKNLLRRRTSIEPNIGHLKNDHR
jgi:IS5 family transposase